MSLTPEITEAQWFLGNKDTLKMDNIHELHTLLFETLRFGLSFKGIN